MGHLGLGLGLPPQPAERAACTRASVQRHLILHSSPLRHGTPRRHHRHHLPLPLPQQLATTTISHGIHIGDQLDLLQVSAVIQWQVFFNPHRVAYFNKSTTSTTTRLQGEGVLVNNLDGLGEGPQGCDILVREGNFERPLA